MRYVIGGVVAGVFVMWLLGTVDQRPPCNAQGDVRYIGSQKYVCERSLGSGLRWTRKY